MKVFNCLYSLGIVDVDVKIEQELPSKTISGGSTHSTGNGDFEVSDDDYTSEFMEMSSKRRRRETRLGFLLCFFIWWLAAQQAATCPILKGQYSIEEKMCIWEGKVTSIIGLINHSGAWV